VTWVTAAWVSTVRRYSAANNPKLSPCSLCPLKMLTRN